MLTRRKFLKLSAAAGASVLVPWDVRLRGVPGVRLSRAFAQGPNNPNGIDPALIAKYQMPLVKPPAMPGKFKKNKDQYKIAVRQFTQQILPPGFQATTVWSYGSRDHPGTVLEGGTFNYPAFTIEATWSKDTQVQWRNELVDANGNFLPHILPVDQTLHWANPPGGIAGRDMHGSDHAPYTGPVPIITHVHGAHTFEDSDGYPEAWYLPAANNIPPGYALTGTYFDIFNAKYGHNWSPGTVSFKYPNTQRATTLWYHDHTLGMTRLNVYAGPAGFYLIRGGPDDIVLDSRDGTMAILPGPAPGVGDAPFGDYTEIPIVIQDRAFNADGSLFYPDNRAFFEELNTMAQGSPYLDIPFWGHQACPLDDPTAVSDVPPIWLPEYFGNVMVVNGVSWPFLNVEKRRYRFRLLNGCNSRFLILDFSDIPGVEVWQIGADGGFLSAPLNVKALNGGKLLMGPAERADVIVDFTNVPQEGSYILWNLGPDEPFGGPGGPVADPNSTGQVMQFRVGPASSADTTTPPMYLQLPAITPLVPTVTDADGNVVLDCTGEVFGPTAALLGTVNAEGEGVPKLWSDPITENPAVGATEVWEIYNHTMDAHPIHIHLVQFQVVNRESFGPDPARLPEPWETGFKDTVIAYPGEITRVKMRFDIAGRYVWHCHIVEHEDNEMMRPYDVV
jgi:FtsP/CotA-like multicopper oxidase with cupredoxin domain